MDKVEVILRQTKDNITSEKIIASFAEAEISSVDSDRLIFPGLEIVLNQRNVYRNGQLVPLTKREFLTLVFLAQHPNWIFTAEQIYDEVWGGIGGSCGAAVATIIGQIRRKLTPNTHKDGYIQTITGRGYKFVIPT